MHEIIAIQSSSMRCRRPDLVCELEFLDKFNILVSFQNLEKYLHFLHIFQKSVVVFLDSFPFKKFPIPFLLLFLYPPPLHACQLVYFRKNPLIKK